MYICAIFSAEYHALAQQPSIQTYTTDALNSHGITVQRERISACLYHSFSTSCVRGRILPAILVPLVVRLLHNWIGETHQMQCKRRPWIHSHSILERLKTNYLPPQP